MTDNLLLFLFIVAMVVLFIMGGAMVLLQTAKKPKIPNNIKTPEEFDREDQEYRDGKGS